MYAVTVNGIVARVFKTETEARVWLAESGLYRNGTARVVYYS